MVELLRRYSKLPIQGISTRIARSERRMDSAPIVPRRITRRLSQEAITQLCADYQAGVSTRQLSETYGLGKTALTRLLRERGVPLRHQGLTPADITAVIQLYETGKSIAQVAQELSLSPSSVYDVLKRAGVQMRPAHEPGRRKRHH